MLMQQHVHDENGRMPTQYPVRTVRGVAVPTVHWLRADEPAARAFGLAANEASHAIGTAPDLDPSLWLARGALALEQAAPDLVRSLRHTASLGCPVIVVRGLPTGQTPPATPYDGVVDQAESRRSIFNLHAVAGCLGLHPIAYVKENASTLHAVCPVRGASGRVSSRGFDAPLPFHTDYADRPIYEPVTDQSPAATFLAFAVERVEPAIPMQCIATRRLLAAMSPRQIRAGQAEEFAVRAPAIFSGAQAIRVRRLFPLDVATDPRCRLNLGTMMGMTARATRLLNEIREILSDESLVERINVARGDIVVMDNQRAIHRRAAFAPRWDDTDRYFIRMSAVRDPGAGLSNDPRRPWIWS